MQDKGGLPDRLWFDYVGNIYDRGLRVDTKDHTFHTGDIIIARAEIGRQRDDPSHVILIDIRKS